MIAAIVQARMGSTRLPGKVMKPLAGEPMIAHTLKRVQAAQTIEQIILATTTHSEDDSLAEFAAALGVNVFRGDENDVLDRYYQAAKENGADVIVRITGDCPVIDPAVIDQTVRLFQAEDCDYASNFVERRFPDGLDTEVFSFDALERAWTEAKLSSEREHVTPYIWKNPAKFRLVGLAHPVDLSAHRWTVDEAVDFEFMVAVFDELYAENPLFDMGAMLELLNRHPELMQINQGIQTNEGYHKSLKSDKGTWARLGFWRYILVILVLAVLCMPCVWLWWESSTQDDGAIPVEIGPLTDSDCRVSCWNGLRPAETTREELEDFLQSNTAVSYDPTNDYVGENDTLYIARYLENVSLALLVDSRGTLRFIALYGDMRLTLEQVIGEFGEPPYVMPQQDMQPNGRISNSAAIFYPQSGYYFVLHSLRGNRVNGILKGVCFAEDDEVAMLKIHEAGSLENLILQANFSITPGGDLNPEDYVDYLDRTMNQLIPWPGFTCIDTP